LKKNKKHIKKVALVHDWFSYKYRGGAEKALKVIDKVLKENYSTPSLYGLVANIKKDEEDWLFERDISTSFINKLPFNKNHFQKYLPLFPLAIEQLDLEDYPLVVSSSHLVAKGVLTSPNQLHVSYVHTPMRYAWDQMNTYLRSSSISRYGMKPILRLILHNLRIWDQLSSMRIDKICTNSNFTAKRIKKYWGRDSRVIYGPVEVDKFGCNSNRGNFYLSVSRLVPNKRVDILVRAFNNLGYPLIVIGSGPEILKIKKIARKNIQVLGFQSDEKIKKLMETCRAFVYAGIEDFGITPVEAMAAGAPVIALKKGGLLDTVNCISSSSGVKTGILFNEQNVKSVIDSVKWFEDSKTYKELCASSINNWSKKFSKENFYSNFKQFLDNSLEDSGLI